MQIRSVVLRRVPPALLGVVSTVALGFETETLMNGGDRWWWLAQLGRCTARPGEARRASRTGRASAPERAARPVGLQLTHKSCARTGSDQAEVCHNPQGVHHRVPGGSAPARRHRWWCKRVLARRRQRTPDEGTMSETTQGIVRLVG